MKDDLEIHVTEKQGLSVSSSPMQHEQERYSEPQRSMEKLPSIANRLGALSAWMFFGSTLIVTGLMGFLAYIWFGTERLPVWHKIIVNNWATRVVSFTSTAIRFCIGTQTTLCLSMLAALALENYYVPHSDVAAVSLMRINGTSVVSTLLHFLYPLTSRGPRFSLSFVTLILATFFLLLTSSILQFTSTLLLSDLHMRVVPDFEVRTDSIPFNYGWAGVNTSGDQPSGGTYNYNFPNPLIVWGGNIPTVYPTFAEYSESPKIQAGIADTGLSLRSFLPISSSTERSSLKDYRGKAMVLDSRVTCVTPNVAQLEWVQGGTGRYSLTGMIQPSLTMPHMNIPSAPVEFYCPGTSWRDQEAYTLCELNNNGMIYMSTGNLETENYPTTYEGYDTISGGLYSYFGPKEGFRSGAAYVVMSNQLPIGEGWLNITDRHFATGSLEIYHQLYVTLCYAALDTADRKIYAHRNLNRTESGPQGTKDKSFDFTQLFEQLKPGSVAERGIMNLDLYDNESWQHMYSSDANSDGPIKLPSDIDYSDLNSWSSSFQGAILPYLATILHLRPTDNGSPTMIGNLSVLFNVETDNTATEGTAIGMQGWLRTLWFNALDSGNSTAFALQTMFTVLAGEYYYDALPLYDKTTDEVIKTSFGPHLAPGGTYQWSYNLDKKVTVLNNTSLNHTYEIDKEFDYQWKSKCPPFFTIVVAILVFHHSLVAMIFIWFWRGSRFSRLGDPWQAVAHVASGNQTARVLESSMHMHTKRTAAYEEMEHAGLGRVCCGLTYDQNGNVILKQR